MIIRIYATESGQNWDSKTLIWRSDRQDETVSDTYYPAAYDVKCSVEAGKIATLKFVISPEHPYYNTFRKKKTILTVIQDGTNAGSDGSKCLFRGAVSEINVDIYQQATITATGALGYLEDSLHVPTGKTGQKKKRSQWLSQALSDHNSQMDSEPEKKFTLGTVGSFQGKIEEDKEVSDTSYSDNMSFIKSNVMDSCNGYLRVRYDSDFSHRYLDFLETYGTTATQKLQFAINIEEISHEDISDDIYTVLVPVGKNAKTLEGYGNGTTAKVPFRNMSGEWETGNDGVTVRINGKNVEIPDAIAKYGYIYKPVSFSDKSTQEAIFEEAKKYISNTYREDNFTLKVKAIDLHYLEDGTPSIRLGDKVTVIRHSKVINSELIERKVIAMCSAIDYDFSNPENTEYTIGTNLENLTNSAGGGGNSSSGSGGGYGGSFHDCIGYMVGDMAVIDHEITQINGGLLDINTSITNINSEIIRLAGRITVTYTYMQSMYSDLSTVINWTYGANESLHAYGEMYEQWLEFQGSTVIQTMDQWGSFVGLWYATYDANGNFLGYVYRNGGGLFIERDNASFGLYDEGNLTGGMIVEKLNDGTVQTTISGDIVNISANTLFRTTVEGLDGRMSNVEQTADSLSAHVTTLEGRISGLRITSDMVDFGFYKASGSGGKTLTAGILVETLSNGSTLTKIKSDYIDFEGMVTADYISSLFLESTRSTFSYLHSEYAVDDTLWVKNGLYLGSNGILPANNVLSSETNILDSIISFNDSEHPIEYSGNNVTIPYKKLRGTWGSLTFRNVTSATGSWSDTGGIYTVIAGDTILAVTSISLRQGYTDGSGTWQSGGWTSNPILGHFTYAEVRSGSKTLLSTVVSGTTPYNYGLKAAQVNGRWSGLTFYYWNTSVGDSLSTNKLTTVTLKYGYRNSGGQWQNSEWTTNSSGKFITYIGAFNGVTSLSESLKITAPTKGLYVDTANHQITLSAQSTTESVSVSATSAITYNSSTHKYTANGTALVNGTQIATSETTGGVEAYNAGIDAGATRVSFIDASSASSSNFFSLTSYDQVYVIQANYRKSDGTNVMSKLYYVKTPPSDAKGLSRDTHNNKIILSASSTTTEYIVAAGSGISYNASDHTYTATGTALVGGSLMSSSTKTSGTEAYTDGRNSINSITWSWTQPTSSSNATLNQGVKATLANDVTSTRYLKITGGTSFNSSHKTSVYVRLTNSSFSTDNSTIVMKTVVDATSEYNAGVAKGKADQTITVSNWRRTPFKTDTTARTKTTLSIPVGVDINGKAYSNTFTTGNVTLVKSDSTHAYIKVGTTTIANLLLGSS